MEEDKIQEKGVGRSCAEEARGEEKEGSREEIKRGRKSEVENERKRKLGM